MDGQVIGNELEGASSSHAFHARSLIRFCETDHAVFEDLIHRGYQVDDVEVDIGFGHLAHGVQVRFIC